MGCWIPNIKINHCPDTPFRYLNFKHESSVVDTTDVRAKHFGKELTTLTYIFEKSGHWRSLALESMIIEYNKERDRKIAQESSLSLCDNYFPQYNSQLFNCVTQYVKLVNQDVLPVCCCDVSPSRHESCT